MFANNNELLTRVWSSSLEKRIAVRVQFTTEETGNCTLFHINKIENIEG